MCCSPKEDPVMLFILRNEVVVGHGTSFKKQDAVGMKIHYGMRSSSHLLRFAEFCNSHCDASHLVISIFHRIHIRYPQPDL